MSSGGLREIERETLLVLERLSNIRGRGGLDEEVFAEKCREIFDALRIRGIRVPQRLGWFGDRVPPWVRYR